MVQWPCAKTGKRGKLDVGGKHRTRESWNTTLETHKPLLLVHRVWNVISHGEIRETEYSNSLTALSYIPQSLRFHAAPIFLRRSHAPSDKRTSSNSPKSTPRRYYPPVTGTSSRNFLRLTATLPFLKSWWVQRVLRHGAVSSIGIERGPGLTILL